VTRMPPNDQVKNYIGKPIPEELYSQLVATHQWLQKKGGGGHLDAHRHVGGAHGQRRQRVPRSGNKTTTHNQLAWQEGSGITATITTNTRAAVVKTPVKKTGI
jgi:hypothetical protein